MKTLVIMRHSKADKSGNYEDFDRPLTEKGQKDAKKVAKQLQKYGFAPDKIYVSNALRTRQTAEIVAKKLYSEDETVVVDTLYSGTVDDYIDLVMQTDDKLNSLMIIGHNPECEGFTEYLTGKLIEIKTSTALLLKFDAQTWADCLRMRPNEFLIFEK